MKPQFHRKFGRGPFEGVEHPSPQIVPPIARHPLKEEPTTLPLEWALRFLGLEFDATAKRSLSHSELRARISQKHGIKRLKVRDTGLF